MTALRRVCVAGLVGVWLVAGGAQEAAEENSADAQAQREAEAQVRQEAGMQVQQDAAAEGDSTAADPAAESDTAEQADSKADAGQTVAGTADGAVAFPEVAPLDELFVPSLGLRADEAWDDMPVDF